MGADDTTGAGRDTDVGADSASGYDDNAGASVSGGDSGDLVKTGSGQTTPTAGSPFSEEEARNADKPESGTPDDLSITSGDPNAGDPSANT